MRENLQPVVFQLVLPFLGLLCFSYFSLSFIPMSLRRPFVPPHSTRNKSVGNKTKRDKEVDVTKSPTTTGIDNQEEGYARHQLITERRVGDDEEDLLPISQVIAADKIRGHRKYDSESGMQMWRKLGQIEKRQNTEAEAVMGNVIPFIPGIKLMSAREADEESKYGEVLR